MTIAQVIATPVRLEQPEAWPYDLTVWAADDAELIHARRYAHTSSDRSLADTLSCVNFLPGERAAAAAGNALQVARLNAIVLGVNSHDELVAALLECRAALTAETIGTVNMDDPDWYEAVAKAVAKADATLSRIPDIQIKGAA